MKSSDGVGQGGKGTDMQIQQASSDGDVNGAAIAMSTKVQKARVTGVERFNKVVSAAVPEGLRKRTFFETIEESMLEATVREVGGVSSKDLKDVGCAIPVALIYTCVYFFWLVYFSVQGGKDLSSQKFLTLTKNNNSYVCTTVPQSLTGSYEGDYKGNWETSSDFLYNQSVFVLEFTGSRVGNDEYFAVMDKFAENLAVLGNKSLTRPLMWNAIVWSSFFFHDTSANMRLFSSADAGVAFNQRVITATIASRTGLCPELLISGSFDSSNKRLTMKVPAIENLAYLADTYNSTALGLTQDPCVDQGNFLGNGFYSQSFAQERNNAFDFNFDVRSVALALTLNFGLSDMSIMVSMFNRHYTRTHSPKTDAHFCLGDVWSISYALPVVCKWPRRCSAL